MHSKQLFIVNVPETIGHSTQVTHGRLNLLVVTLRLLQQKVVYEF